MKRYTLLITVGILLLLPAIACANGWYEYGFKNVTNNSTLDASIGEAQLTMTVKYASNRVYFVFGNEGSEASSITDIYFDDDTPFLLMKDTYLIDDSKTGVSFSPNASPSNLPGASSVGFSSNWSADSDSPVQPNGVNPGESLTISFEMAPGEVYGDENSGLIAALNDGTFSVGLHVQGFDSGGSESFITNEPGDPVPEPATMLLFGTGMIGLAGLTRRKLKS